MTRSLGSRLSAMRFPLARPTWPGGVPRPAPERHVGLGYDHDWSRRYPVRLARAMVLDNVTRPLARAMVPTTVMGLEQLGLVDGPVIFAANHASHLDTPLLLTALPVDFRHHTVVAAASDYFFDRTWKAVVWSFAIAAIPIERTRVNRQSADTAAELLADGWSLVIFPEGGRSSDGWTQPFTAGAAYLARRTGAPIIPVFIKGTRDVLGKRADAAARARGGSGTENRARRGPHRAPVTVVFGAPLVPDADESARRFSARVERAVALLGNELASDWWTARRRAAAGTSPSPHGPDAAAWRRAWALGPPAADAGEDRPWPAGWGAGGRRDG